jgi:vitamin B12 transporter
MRGIHMVASVLATTAALVCGNCALVVAQSGAAAISASDTALAACTRAAEANNENEAKPLTARAEAEYRALAAAHPQDADARVLLARVLVQCRLPFASFIGKGRLVGQANELLEEALSIDSTHWSARFTLAQNHFHTPDFLGKTGDAIREFEHLLAQQGERTTNPAFAITYLQLGDLYLRRKRTDEAIAMWKRGAALFPEHQGLRERLQKHTGAGIPSSPAMDSTPAQPTYTLDGVVVAASAVRMDDARSGTALRRMDVLTVPGGAADLMAALQTGPGTTAAAEGSDLYVRGGDPAEAPVWIDGARLFYAGRYETLHGGVFDILDPAVLKSAFFSSGGFSARYGNALSGVLDVESEGLPTVRTGHAALNTVQMGGMLQLPLGQNAGFWTAVRATDATAMLAMHGRSDEFSVAPRALEEISALAWEPRAGTQIKATALLDADRSARDVDAWGYSGAFESRGANRLVGLSARTVGAGGRTMLRANLAASSRTSTFAFGVLDRERTDRGLTARVDGELQVDLRNRLRAGFEASGMDARHQGMLPETDQLAPGSPAEWQDETESTSHFGGYVEAEIAPTSRLALVAGVRADRLPGEDALTADPRLAVAMRVEEWTLRLGGGVFHQGRWRTRYTLPSSDAPSGVPRRARHLVAGAERQGEPALKVEAYMKDYDRYAAAGEGPTIAAGRATGADAILRWSRQERLNGWLTYSHLRGRIELEDGRTAPSAVDVTHSLTAVGRLKLWDGWQLGTTARYATGRPVTTPGGVIHGDRLPEYRRLDARLIRFWSVRTGTMVTYLELLNALDHANVVAYTSDSSGERRAVPTFFADRTAVFGASLSF